MGILKRSELIGHILDYDSGDWAKLLTGVRQSGKTTLIKGIIEELKNRGVSEENIIYISFYSCQFYSKTTYEIYKKISSKINDIDGKKYLFFDDVEEFEDWQYIVDVFRKKHDCEVYAGVNYSKFYTLGKNYLSGKSIRFEIYPFSFKEFVQYKRKFFDEDKSEKELFSEYLRFGGMPEVVQLKKPEEKYHILENIFNWVRYEDFIKDTDLESWRVEDFLRYVTETFTEKFSKSKINQYFEGLFDDDTLSQCLYYLGKSSFSKKSTMVYNKRLRFDEKYYLADHGFYTQLYRHFILSPDNLIRNIIYVELLRRGFRVFFYENRENYIDFVCHSCNKTILIQFDYIFASKSIIKREIEFLDSYGKDFEKYIITTGNYDFSQYGVKHLNVIDFLVGDEIVT